MMRSFVSMVVVCAVACGTSTDEPRLTAIEPAAVTALVDTAGVVRGSELDAVATLDLDSTGKAKVDRGWRVRIGDVPVGVATWIDRQTIDVVIPRGLAAGVHDVFATSPEGVELVLPDALTVTSEPLGLVLAIEDAPGGTGAPVTGTLAAGQQRTAFAVVRDAQQAFIADVAVAWDVTSPIGALAGGPGSMVTLTAMKVGTAKLTAHQAGAALDAMSGELVVVAGPATHIAIVDAAGGTGSVIGDRTGLTTDSDGGLTAYAIGLDAYDNFTGDEPVTWSLTGVTGALVPPVDDLTAVDFTTPGTGVLHASHATIGDAATGSLEVTSGKAAVLGIQPNTRTINADDAPEMFTATAIDADGNATTNLGTLTWAVASGPITTLDAATGTLDPQTAGSGTIAVASSLGPTTTSGTITVESGAPVSVVVSPSTLTATADDAATTFTAAITDGDGNATSPGTLTWSVASGPITSMAAATGAFTPTLVGTGTIAATTSNGITGTAMVTVTPGRAAALTIAPNTLVVSEGGQPVQFTATATDADGNPTTDLGTLTWAIANGPITAINPTTGVLQPTAPGTGAIRVTSSYGPTKTTGTITILSAADLSAGITLAPQVSVGQTFSVPMQVNNPGQVGALNVTACALTIGGTGTAAIVTSPAVVPSIAPGGNATLTWTVTATAAGTLTFTTCVNATDAQTNAPLTAPASVSTTALTAPLLTATLSMQAVIGRAAPFTVTMIVTNGGQVTATGVLPNVLTNTGSGTISLTSAAPGGQSIAAGGSATYTWTYQATALGTVRLQGTASGTNALSAAAVSTPLTTSNTANIVEAYLAMADPFGDGTASGFVTRYRGRVHVGPNKTGTTAFSMLPDATAPLSSTFTFTRDTTGNTSANSSTPYTSIGALGCAANTAACGPDNENQRGLFAGVTFGGTEWMIASGAKTTLDGVYVYMSTSAASPLAFRYVDLSAPLTNGTVYGASALGVVGNRLYVGTAGANAGRSQLIAVTASPPSPGLDASGSNAIDMQLQNLDNWGTGTNPSNVDAIANVGGLVYVANKQAWVRASTTSPVPMPDLCLLCCLLGCQVDWVNITPTAAAYTSKTSRSTSKGGQLEPADRAVPQIVQFGSRLFAARNTTTGPQLWGCNLTSSRCNADGWTLVAANSTGDTQLSQFNNPALTSITMLAATPSYLYVGFDSAAGVQLFRTANSAATARSAFEGTNGCSAANHPATCAGYGGAGLGAASNTRIFDGEALTFGTTTTVWMTVGNGTNPLGLVMLP